MKRKKQKWRKRKNKMVFGNINIFQASSMSIGIISSALCLSNNNEIEKVENNFLKKEIMKILTERGEKVSISYLAEELNNPPRKIVSVLKELEEEGLIKEAQ